MHSSWLEVADRQAGVISARQLQAAGVSRRQLGDLIGQGLVRRVTRGVFVTGFEDAYDPWQQQLWTALMGAGAGAVVFRRSAAALWNMDGCPRTFVEVAVPPGRQSRFETSRRTSLLLPGQTVEHEGLLVTTPARTLADLGAAAPESVVERALESALRRKLVTVRDLDSVLVDARFRGSGVLRRVLRRRPPGVAPTESDAETLFLQLTRKVGLPEPRRQYGVILDGKRYRMDFAWTETRIASEIDGASVHAQPGALRSDLLRQNRIILDGWVILRYTWYDIVNHPHDIVGPHLISAWTLRGGLLRPAGGLHRRPTG